MSPYQIEVIDDEPHGCPPWVMKIAIFGLLVIMALIVRMAVGLSLAFLHYRSAQDFNSFVTERAVSEEVASSWLPVGEVLADGESWILGEEVGDDLTKLSASTEVTITHGSESLLDVTVKLQALADKEDWKRRKVWVSVPEIETDPRMHAIVQVGVLDVERVLASTGGVPGSIFVDVLLVAGAGEDQFRVVELDQRPPHLDGINLAWPIMRAVFGLMHPSGELPEQGLLHQARSSYSLSWNKDKGDTNGLGLMPLEARTNCTMFSYETKVTQRSLQSGHMSFSLSRSWKESYSWDEKLW